MRVVVLGMHRSGTSLLVRSLRALGCHLGAEDEFHPADAGNPRGNWERRDVWELNEEILASRGAAWFHLGPVGDPGTWGEEGRRFRERAGQIVRRLDRAGAWAIKDPRLAPLFPIWRQALDRPLCLISVRHPLQVAESLRRRDGLPVVFSLALWRRHVLDALRFTKGLPRLRVLHADLLKDPLEALRPVAAAMGRLGSAPVQLESGGLAEWVDPSLFRARGVDVNAECLDAADAELWRRLESGVDLDDISARLGARSRDLLDGYGELRLAWERLGGRASGLDHWAARFEDLLEPVRTSRRFRLADGLARWGRRLSGRPARAGEAQRLSAFLDEYRRWRRSHPIDPAT